MTTTKTRLMVKNIQYYFTLFYWLLPASIFVPKCHMVSGNHNIFNDIAKILSLHSDFAIWLPNTFPEFRQLFYNYQIAIININKLVQVSSFQEVSHQQEKNTPNKLYVFILQANLSRIGFIAERISKIRQHDRTKSRSLALNENNWRSTYFLVWPSEEQNNLREFSNPSNKERILRRISKNFLLTSDFYILDYRKYDSATNMESEYTILNIIEIYSIGDIPVVEKLFLESCSPEDNNSLEMKILNKVSRRRNFHLIPVVAVSQQGEANRVVMTEHENGSATLISGHEIEEYRYLRDFLNFTEKAVNSTGWAYVNQDGVYMGMAGQLLRKEAEIAITNSELVENWSEDLIFLHPTYFSTMWCFFVQPAASSFRDIFIQAFTLPLWLTLLVLWIVIILIIISSSWIREKMLQDLHDSDKTFIHEILIWASGSVCQQGWYICPETISLRILLICGVTMNLLLMIAYSASLVSILSVKVLPVKSLDDLIHQKFVVNKGSELLSTGFVLDELISSGKLLTKGEMWTYDAIPKILSSKFALLSITDIFHPIIQSRGIPASQICSLVSQIPVNWRPITAAMFLPKNSEYEEQFNYVLLKMHERGNRYRLLSHYMKDSALFCVESEKVNYAHLGIPDVFTAIILWISGCILGCVVLLNEKLYEKMRMRFYNFLE